MTYASGTDVTPERSRAEIERILMRYGATKFYSGWDDAKAVIGFEAKGRRIRFDLPLPTNEEMKPAKGKEPPGWRSKSTEQRDAWYNRQRERLTRSRWRALVLCIKAKLEAVDSGITSFEAEFLAFIVLPDSRTVGEWAARELPEIYQTGKMPPMLGAGSGT